MKITDAMIYSYCSLLPYWETVMKVVSFLNLKSVTIFLVTGWEGYLASPESLFVSETVKAEAWKQSSMFLWMT